MVVLMRVALPGSPRNAATNSGRVAWFSIVAGSAPESASTLPVESITVIRASAARAACVVISLNDAGGELTTREANICVFCRREVSISLRSMPSHARRMRKSKVSVHVTTINSAARNSLRKMRLLTVAPFGLRLGHLEAVACAADRLQIARLVGVRFDLLTNAAHVHIHGAWCDVVGVAPNRIQQLIACEDASGMTREIFQQAELCRRGLSELATDRQRHAATVDLQIARLHDGGRQRTLEATQHGAHTRHHLARAEGF